MRNIAFGRLILGGLVAGLAMNILESLTNAVLKAPYWTAAMSAIGKPAYTSAGLALFILWGFVFGFVAVWTYAAIRPRFGAGPGTAMIAGVTVWVPAYVLCFLTLFALGIIPLGLAALACVIGIVESVIATIIGAYLYRE